MGTTTSTVRNVIPPAVKSEVAIGRTLGILSFSPFVKPRSVTQILTDVDANLYDIVGTVAEEFGLDSLEITKATLGMVRSLQTDRSIGVAQYSSTLAILTRDQRSEVSAATALMQHHGKITNAPDYNRFRADLRPLSIAS